VSGADAESFLQGQLTQDVARHLPAWSLLLQPDSSVVSTVWVEHADDFVLTVPEALFEAVLSRLQRFRLRVAVMFEEVVASQPPLTEDMLFDLPWPHDVELGAGLVPHAYGRAVVNACVSETKGCYTGQELVGRLEARGANTPWRLWRAPLQPTLDDAMRCFEPGPEGPKFLTRWRRVEVDGVSYIDSLGIAHRSVLASDEG
jgi:folate-binding Fe-S cluster repair protein YgfZ